MVIAHVIDSMDVGGAEAVVAALCRLQMAAGHTVSVHCLFDKGVVAEQLEMDGVPVLVHGPAPPAGIVWRIYKAFRTLRPAVVHCHNKSATVHAAAVARLAGARVLVSTRHGMAALPYRLRKELKFWVTAALFCDRVVAVCDAAHRNMRAGARSVAHKVVTIRNGAYPSAARPDSNVQKRGFALVTVGRLAPAKSYDTLLRSVALARRSVPDLALWIVGNGSEAASLQQLSGELGVDDIVQFCGERADVGSWLRCADVFVLSSISEGLPISILEAMAAGLPTIVTDVGGMPEVVSLSRAGATVPARDIDTLASAIVEFAGRRDELKELGQRARSCYIQHFTPERMADQYLTLYQTCLSARRTEV
jgi:glycosyltransferase involved in cell wall biosynthesis